jgi:hypothetical protein
MRKRSSIHSKKSQEEVNEQKIAKRSLSPHRENIMQDLKEL